MALLAVAACKKPPPPEQHDAPPPTDHLAPGEVPAGRERAFELELPRDAHVVLRFPDSVQIKSSLDPEAVSNFVRARVKSGKAIVGSTMTNFEHVVVPSHPERELSIEIRRTNLPGSRTAMIVRDVTPLPAAAIPSAEAWRRLGAGPDGKLLDPRKVE